MSQRDPMNPMRKDLAGAALAVLLAASGCSGDGGGDRPTTLPAGTGGPLATPAMAPSRPSTASRPTSRPAPRRR